MLRPISAKTPRFGCDVVTRRVVGRMSVVGRESGHGVAEDERGGCQAGAASGVANTAGISTGGAASGAAAGAGGGRGSVGSGIAGDTGGAQAAAVGAGAKGLATCATSWFCVSRCMSCNS